MDFRQLEMFLAVAQNLSFTEAGRKLFVAQSAVSRKVRLLEDELGEKLFKRVNKRVYLTHAGETLASYARRIFLDLRNAAMEVQGIANLTRGRITVGGGMTACICLLPPVLERFKAAYPNVEAVVETGQTDVLLRQIRTNELDLGVVTLPVRFPDLKVIPLCKEELVLVCSSKHPKLRHRRSIKSREIPLYPLILWDKRAKTRTLLDEFFEKNNIEPVIAMESDSVATIKPLVAANLGASILPLRAVRQDAKRGELHYVRISDYQLTREIGLVFPKTEQLPNVFGRLIELFQEVEQEQSR